LHTLGVAREVPEAGRVRLAAFPSALGSFVPQAAATFSSEHPGVELRFTEAEPPDAARLLRSGEVDVALLFAYPDTQAAEDDTLRRVRLLSEPIYLVTPAVGTVSPERLLGMRGLSRRCRTGG
jgi:DNA-binding transcriptional LysR family regulator